MQPTHATYLYVLYCQPCNNTYLHTSDIIDNSLDLNLGSDILTTYVCKNFGFQGEKFIKVNLYVSIKMYIPCFLIQFPLKLFIFEFGNCRKFYQLPPNFNFLPNKLNASFFVELNFLKDFSAKIWSKCEVLFVCLDLRSHS